MEKNVDVHLSLILGAAVAALRRLGVSDGEIRDQVDVALQMYAMTEMRNDPDYD